MHMIQALNGNKCNAYFVSGKIKELKKKASLSVTYARPLLHDRTPTP